MILVKSNLTAVFLILTGLASQQEKLYFAIQAGNESRVAKLIQEGVDVNGTAPQGPTTPLIVACVTRQPNIVKMLLEAGADVNQVDPRRNNTALLFAVRDPEIVELLLKNNANPNMKNKMGKTALMAAIKQNNLDVVKALLAAGADVNAKDKEGNTTLKLAQEAGNEEIIQLLKSAGAKE